jgi:hypothetical protein
VTLTDAGPAPTGAGGTTAATWLLDRIAKLLAFTVVVSCVKLTPVVYSRPVPVIVITFPPLTGPILGVREASTGGAILVKLKNNG